jgi:hypothetical protein
MKLGLQKLFSAIWPTSPGSLTDPILAEIRSADGVERLKSEVLINLIKNEKPKFVGNLVQLALGEASDLSANKQFTSAFALLSACEEGLRRWTAPSVSDSMRLKTSVLAMQSVLLANTGKSAEAIDVFMCAIRTVVDADAPLRDRGPIFLLLAKTTPELKTDKMFHTIVMDAIASPGFDGWATKMSGDLEVMKTDYLPRCGKLFTYIDKHLLNKP